MSASFTGPHVNVNVSVILNPLNSWPGLLWAWASRVFTGIIHTNLFTGKIHTNRSQGHTDKQTIECGRPAQPSTVSRPPTRKLSMPMVAHFFVAALVLVATHTHAALTHAAIRSTPTTAKQLAAAALKAGALLAKPSPTGQSVSLLLPQNCINDAWPNALGAGCLLDAEPMWEPDDWQVASTTFKEICVSSSLWVRPLPLKVEVVMGKRTLPEVQLLEHPHAFLTTAAGQLHASTLNVLELLVAHAAELRAAERFLDFGAGSGILSMAAHALAGLDEMGGLRSYGVDCHEPAISAAQRNAWLNGVGGPGRISGPCATLTLTLTPTVFSPSV